MGTNSDWKQRASRAVVAVALLIVAFSVAYHNIIIVYEGRDPSYLHSLQVTVETFTGTGYGSDAGWDTTVANIFVTFMDLSTFLFLFIVFPYVFQPVLEQALSPSPSHATDQTDHIVLCGYTDRDEQLISEFESRGVDYVVVDEDSAETIALEQRGFSAMHGDPTSIDVLERARVAEASAVVVDVDDNEAASTVLAIRELNKDVRTVVLADDIGLERYLDYAGADQVLTPKQLLGHRIAERIATEIDPHLSDATMLTEDFGLVEITTFEHSPLADRTVQQIGELGDPNLAVVAMWKHGEFLEPVPPDAVVEDHDVLLITGPDTELKEFEKKAYPRRTDDASVIIAGFGEVGSTIRRHLPARGVDCTVVDTADRDGVDIVGDITDEEVMERAGLRDATTLVLSIPRDHEAIHATIVARKLNPDLDIVVRVNQSKTENKVRRAGADYVLSLPTISGRMLALHLLQEDVMSYGLQLKTIRLDVSHRAGEPLGHLGLADTNCVLVGVERKHRVVAAPDRDFVIEPEDRLLLAGEDEVVDRIESQIA